MIVDDSLVMDDVTLDSTLAAVEPGHVDASESKAPCVDAMRHDPGGVAQGDRVPQRSEYGARADQVTLDIVGRLPLIDERVEPAAEPDARA
ncbi:hypothetical protein ACFQ0K_11580 [Nocardioides caeni]|uniref:hypothetical protein n=1 Tax=Nocardioides caeni TaxID=574700 RepID=UPI0013053C0B|nr:hypothetical protein [Nocardioides caeni]